MLLFFGKGSIKKMKKILALILVLVMSMSLVACGADKVKNFDQLDTNKFNAFLNGDGDCVVLYEGVIDDAVMGATLSDEKGTSVTLAKDNIFKNGDGHSGLWFGDCEAAVGDTLNLTLSKDGFESISFTVTVQ